MAKRRRKRRSYRRGRTSRWFFDLTDAGLGAVAELVGSAIQTALPGGTPDFIRSAPVQALGLYALGVAFSKKALRGVGAGMALGRLFGGLTGGVGGP